MAQWESWWRIAGDARTVDGLTGIEKLRQSKDLYAVMMPLSSDARSQSLVNRQPVLTTTGDGGRASEVWWSIGVWVRTGIRVGCRARLPGRPLIEDGQHRAW